MRKPYGDEDIARLQNCLVSIRLAGGWSAETFGKMIGASKSTISNLENGKVTMSKSRYESICTVLDNEIKKSKDDYLSTIIAILTDKNLTEDRIVAAKAYIIGAKRSKLSKDIILAAIEEIVGING